MRALMLSLLLSIMPVFAEDYFTPYDDGLSLYLSMLDKAEKQVRIQAYGFTHDEIINKLVQLHDRGIDVRVNLDKSQSGGVRQKRAIRILRKAGIPVTIGTSSRSHQLSHSKYTVVDCEWLETGSLNYSQSGFLQDNTFEIVRSKERAGQFIRNWNQVNEWMARQGYN